MNEEALKTLQEIKDAMSRKTNNSSPTSTTKTEQKVRVDTLDLYPENMVNVNGQPVLWRVAEKGYSVKLFAITPQKGYVGDSFLIG